MGRFDLRDPHHPRYVSCGLFTVAPTVSTGLNCISDLRTTENSPSKRGACVGRAGDYREWRKGDLTLDGITFLPVVSYRLCTAIVDTCLMRSVA